jgi:aminoglycoside phosphotransferase (APT) family kinase protein
MGGGARRLRRRARRTLSGGFGSSAPSFRRGCPLHLPWDLELGDPFHAPFAKNRHTGPPSGRDQVVVKIHVDDDVERHGRPYERRLLDEALDALRVLGPSQRDVVLCHQDLHGGNILSAEREPWLAIDSKPIVAEPAYDMVPAVRDLDEDGRITAAEMRRRLDRLSALLGVDRERVRRWTIAKHLAWATGGQYFPYEVEMVRTAVEVGS